MAPAALLLGLVLVVLAVVRGVGEDLGSYGRLSEGTAHVVAAAFLLIDVIITDGAYKFSRHPFYLGSSLTLIGAAVAGRSWLGSSSRSQALG